MEVSKSSSLYWWFLWVDILQWVSYISADGKTGIPFVDANMRELLATGWMSNRGRQNVASFLARDLQLDWRLGAEWFESFLVSKQSKLQLN